MKCKNHPERDAAGFCFRCGRPFCEECLIESNGKKRKIVSGICDETKIMIDTILHPPKNSSKKKVIKKQDYYQYFCSKCGNEIQLNQDFCLSCGSKLTKDIIEPRLNNTKSCDC
jgi:hypothetical protein